MMGIKRNYGELNLIGSSLNWSYKVRGGIVEGTINLDENILYDGIINDCGAFNEIVNSIGIPIKNLIINFKSSKVYQEKMIVPKLKIFEKNKLINTFVNAKMINLEDYKVFTSVKNSKKGESTISIIFLPKDIINIFRDLLKIIGFNVRGLYIWNEDYDG